jgi:hypothetical protein
LCFMCVCHAVVWSKILNIVQNELDNLIASLDHLNLNGSELANLSKNIVENLENLSSFEMEVLSLFGCSRSDPKVLRALEHAWENFDNISPSQQARRRLAVGVLSKDDPLDTHTGGYLATFASSAGLDAEKIKRIFADFLESL